MQLGIVVGLPCLSCDSETRLDGAASLSELSRGYVRLGEQHKEGLSLLKASSA